MNNIIDFAEAKEQQLTNDAVCSFIGVAAIEALLRITGEINAVSLTLSEYESAATPTEIIAGGIEATQEVDPDTIQLLDYLMAYNCTRFARFASFIHEECRRKGYAIREDTESIKRFCAIKDQYNREQEKQKHIIDNCIDAVMQALE